MFDSFLAVPLHFTVEFLGFLVTAGAGMLVLARPTLIPGAAFNRIAAALGFAALAAAQIVHGGSFLERDGADLLIALQALGLALIVVGVVGGMGAGVPAAAVVPARLLEEPFLLAPAVAALLLALMASLTSAKNGPRELRRLALAALFLAASSVLTAFRPDALFGLGEADPYLYSAHGTKALAFVFLGSWLWSGVRSSIRTRFVASFAALLVLVVLALSTALTGVITNNVEEAELRETRTRLENVVQGIKSDDTVELLNDVEQIAELEELVQRPVATGADLKDLAENLLDTNLFEMDFVVFGDPSGGLEAYAGNGPAVFKNRRPTNTILRQSDVLRIIGSKVVRVVARDPLAALNKIGEDAVAIVAAAHVPDPDLPTRTVGTVVIGRFVDAKVLSRISSDLQPAKASLIVQNRIVESALPRAVTKNEDLVPARVEGGQPATRKQAAGRTSFFSSFAPLTDDRGVPIGAALMLSSPARIVADTREDVTQTLFLVALGTGLIVLVLAWFSGRRITRPIQMLTTTARAVREGDLTAQTLVSGEDEVGQLGETFNEMTATLNRTTNDLRDAAREEQSLRGRIETIIQSMADGLVAVDADRKILAFNLEAENLTGIKASSVIGQSVEKIIDARDPQGLRVPLPIFDLAEGSVGGVFVQHRSGDLIPVAVTSAVLRGHEDEVTGGVAVLRDMSREREVERMKTEFLSNISHELRTPLTPIKGYAEILERKEVPPEKVKQFVKAILDSTGRLERIVGLLVDFSAMEAGRLAPRAAPVDLGSLMEALVAQVSAPRHRITLDVKSRVPNVIGDERLLRRSLEEVLDNAVKFSPEGGEIALELRGANAGNGRGVRHSVQIVISDEGIGIPPEDLPKIFSDFHQLDGSETRTYGGLGLGLAFVQRIVEAHNGSLAVESAPDRGTRLTITIPAAQTTA